MTSGESALRLTVRANRGHLRYGTARLLNRMFSPMCGLDQSISFILRGSNEPRFISSGCHPTGMHMIQNPEIETAPNPLSYHIGGSGFFLDEAIIRALGETAERYAQIVSEATGQNSVVFGTRESLPRSDRAVIDETAQRFLTDEQLHLPDCPFEPSGPESPFGWICVESLVDGKPTWVPAQLFLVGYRVKTKREEPRIWSAVTTGTAVHTDLWAATKSALLELVQIDAAMGHWYCNNTAPRLNRTSRTEVVMRLVDRILRGSSASARFHVLRSAGLPGFYIACVLTSDDGSPALGVGLGADTRLPTAIYKSLLEGIAVLQLAKVIRLYTPEGPQETDGGAYSDLNSNVLHYATDPAAMRHLDSKFPVDETVDPEELPADLSRGPQEISRHFITAFREAGMDLLHLDITPPDIASLGLVAQRVWSPQLLGLCLPSWPQQAHPRFSAYGGAAGTTPHPYP